MKHTLENHTLLVEIEDRGAELVRIFDKANSREIMWSGDPAYWGRRAPVLFPNVGRHWKDAYRIHGNAYPSSQHGFARDSEFRCVSCTENEVVHELTANEKTLEKYPFPFLLRIRHTLNGHQLTVCWEVENLGQETMYFTIGGHPAFRVPDGASLSEMKLAFPGKQELSYLLITPDGSGTADAAHPHVLFLQDGTCLLDKLKDKDEVLAERMFDKDALIFDGDQFSEVRLLLPDGAPYVTMYAEGFPNFGIWSAPGAPFVCLEPWMGRTDDTGYEGTLDQKPWINVLQPGQLFRKSYVIEV